VDAMKKDRGLLAELRDKYEHIFVDEVQDLQPLTRKFIRLLVGKRQSLFAIGDDYQSIYSFAGSDPLFMVRFESYFPDAALIKLQYNYRCHPGIVGISNTIIRNNSVQLFKKVEGKYLPGQKAEDKTLTLITLINEERQREKLVDYIMSEVPKKESLKILARYNFILDPYRDILTEEYPGRKYEFLTIHRSKGLESDNVLILDCVKNSDCKYCFPAEDHHQKIRDRVLRLCRGNKFNLEEEETRLYYVAVTRARRHVYVATVSGKQSEFVNEKYLPRDMIEEKNIAQFSIDN
jgi:DNA helicase-4